MDFQATLNTSETTSQLAASSQHMNVNWFPLFFQVILVICSLASGLLSYWSSCILRVFFQWTDLKDTRHAEREYVSPCYLQSRVRISSIFVHLSFLCTTMLICSIPIINSWIDGTYWEKKSYEAALVNTRNIY